MPVFMTEFKINLFITTWAVSLPSFKWLLQFFSVALVHFSNQNLNYQSSHRRHLCISKKQFLISLNKLQMIRYIHANDHMAFPTLSIVYKMINCW